MEPRTKLVAFRLSEEEYEQLRAVSTAHAARSISEFVRAGIGWIVETCDRRVWESIVSFGQGAFSPARSSQGAPRLQSGREQMAGDLDRNLARSEITDLFVALQAINKKIDALSGFMQDQSADRRKIG